MVTRVRRRDEPGQFSGVTTFLRIRDNTCKSYPRNKEMKSQSSSDCASASDAARQLILAQHRRTRQFTCSALRIPSVRGLRGEDGGHNGAHVHKNCRCARSVLLQEPFCVYVIQLRRDSKPTYGEKRRNPCCFPGVEMEHATEHRCIKYVAASMRRKLAVT